MRLRVSILFLLLLSVCIGPLGHAAVTMKVDSVADLTRVLQDFNGSTNQASGYGNNTDQPRPAFVESIHGVSTYVVAPSTVTEGVPYPSNHDPQINFTSQPYNVHEFNHVRVRSSYHVEEGVTLNKAPSSEMWPRSAEGATTLSFGVLSTTYNEYRAVWRNPNDPSISTAVSGGFRWDPIVGGITQNAPLYFNLDYVMVDRGRVVGFEFDSTGNDVTQHRLNFSPVQIDAATLRTENGALKGITTSTDPHLIRTGLEVEASVYKFVEIRLRRDAAVQGTSSDVLQVFWTTNITTNNMNVFNEAKSYKLKASEQRFDGDWHTYLFDFTDEATWTSTIKSLRIDLGTLVGAEFELDYLRFREIGAVPEPSKVVLGALGLAVCLLRRRKS